ncbi:hypothetical protein M422DRAFT_29270 [Sphaerobolus stellatus SS14]|nr:hypothetical protein M422DRAFT_29270 [Sphaerobolus stellatus SS14]
MPEPSLPPLDPVWFSAIFGGQASNDERQDVPGRDRLAFLGETILHLGVMAWLNDRYPRYNRVNLKEKQAELATPKKAASWGQLYRLLSRLNLTAMNALQPGSVKPSNADLFLAYLGAVYLSNGVSGLSSGTEVAVKWIGDILQYEEEEGKAASDSDWEEETVLRPSSQPAPRQTAGPPWSCAPPPAHSIPSPHLSREGTGINALSQVNEKLAQRGVVLEWDETPFGADHTRKWILKTKFNGKEYTGEATTKKVARTRAAEKIWQDLNAEIKGRRR